MKVLFIDLLLAVAEETGVSIAAMLSKSQKGATIDARRIAIKLLFDTGFSSEFIQTAFCLDRTQVYRHIQRQIQLNRIYKQSDATFKNCERRLSA